VSGRCGPVRTDGTDGWLPVRSGRLLFGHGTSHRLTLRSRTAVRSITACTIPTCATDCYFVTSTFVAPSSRSCSAQEEMWVPRGRRYSDVKGRGIDLSNRQSVIASPCVGLTLRTLERRGGAVARSTGDTSRSRRRVNLPDPQVAF
jgi:hypothetical protein